ncbi:MAG: glycosyltransferase [Actinomycetota bacterium]
MIRRQFPSEIGAGRRTDPAPAASEGTTLRPGTTVLVVAYNHQAFVRETLESILHQTRQPTAVLIAEDASPGVDATAAVVADVLSHAPDSWQYLPNPENIGLNRTLNKLLARVDTEFVTYIAADDTMAASRIEAHEDLLRASSPDAALAYSDATVIDQDSAVLHDSSRVEFPWPDEPERSTQTLACLVRSNWIPAASLFLRTAVLRAAGGYAEDLFYEDYKLLTRLAARHPFVYTEEPLVAVRRLATSLGAVGFAHGSPRFIRSLAAALGNAVDADDADVRADAQRRRWELAKRAKRVGMPRHEVLRMMWNAREGSQSPSRALAHMAAAAARPSRAVKRSSTH